jgi:hypothetical protein
MYFAIIYLIGFICTGFIVGNIQRYLYITRKPNYSNSNTDDYIAISIVSAIFWPIGLIAYIVTVLGVNLLFPVLTFPGKYFAERKLKLK